MDRSYFASVIVIAPVVGDVHACVSLTPELVPEKNNIKDSQLAISY